MDADSLYRLIERSWGVVGSPGSVLLAVSGGGDSAALLRIGARLKSHGVSVSAATVDHGLRAEAAREAKAVATWCAELGLPHATLVWRGEKPASGLQAAARSARYGLLARHANEIGASVIFTAHTEDDVAETFLMRLARGAGAEGLAEMSRQSLIADGAGEPVMLLRPWLDVPRASLRAFLDSTGAPFIDDPSNDDTRFERVRLRQFIPRLAEEAGIDVAALARSARRLASDAENKRRVIHDAFNAAGGVFYRWGGASLSLLPGADDLPALLARVVYAVSGEEHAPGMEQATKALTDVRATGRASLGGVIIERGKDRIWFYREPAALTGRAGVAPMSPMNIAAGERKLWDGRFVISAARDSEIGPAGLVDLSDAPELALFEGPRVALTSLPALRSGGGYAILSVSASPEGVSCQSLAPERFSAKVNRF